MTLAKRIILFLLMNLAIMLMLEIVMAIFGVKPQLSSHGLNYTSLLIFSAVIGFSGSFISLFLTKKVAKWTTNMQMIEDPRDHQSLKIMETISRIAQGLNIKMPEVGIYPSQEVNAFATGWSKNNSLVAVSEGLLREMTDEELEGVLAHEMAHIANGDMVTMTLLQGVINTFVIFFARVAAFALQRALSDKEEVGHLAYVLTSLLFEMVFGVLASTILYAYSRRREYAADLGGAQFAGKAKMIAGLKRLQTLTERVDTSQKSLATMKISDRRNKFGLLFSSHPPLEDRIARLQNAPVN